MHRSDSFQEGHDTTSPKESVATESIGEWKLLYKGLARTDASINAWDIGEVREKESHLEDKSLCFTFMILSLTYCTNGVGWCAIDSNKYEDISEYW